MVLTQRATQGAILAMRITTTVWHTKLSWVVISGNDRAISPDQQRSTAKRMKLIRSPCVQAHLAMLAKPTEVARFTIDAAASLGSSPLALAS